MAEALAGPAPPEETLSGVVFETILLSLVRGIFFLVCRHYVNLSLFSGLKSVIYEDHLSSDTESPEVIALDDAEGGYFPSSSTSNLLASSKGRARSGSLDGNGAGGVSAPLLSPRKSLPRRDSTSPVGYPGSTYGGSAYPKLATSLFCLCFSESCMLFTLVLFGEAFGQK